MHWTREAPNAPGWYWARYNGGFPSTVRVKEDEAPNQIRPGLVMVGPTPFPNVYSMNEAEWAGPIQAPDDAPKPMPPKESLRPIQHPIPQPTEGGA